MRACLFLFAVVSLQATGSAAERCPWLNAATAGGFLGGAVTNFTVNQGKSGDDATCEFVRHDGSLLMELRIEVETMRSPADDFASYTSRCRSAAVALKAMGNQAVSCAAEAGDGRIAGQVVGRVRDRAFVVRVATSDRSAQPAALREKARKAAEQVAGNLF